MTTPLAEQSADNPLITEFAPDSPQIAHGASVKLTWHGPEGDCGYTLWRSDRPGEPTPIVPEQVGAACSFVAQDLTQAATAFLLVVSVPGNVEDRAVTSVIVTDGDVFAGALSATGKTTLLRTPRDIPVPGPSGTTYTAATDGFLAANVTTLRAGARATLTIDIRPTGSGSPLTRVLNADEAQVHVDTLLPVPTDADLTVSLTGDRPRADIVWIPLGNGDLTPHPG